MRNDAVGGRAEKGGANARAFVRPQNGRKARRTLDPRALVVLDYGGTTYRRLTPEHAERVAAELLAAAADARLELGEPAPARRAA